MTTMKTIDPVDVIFQNILNVDKSRSPRPRFPLVPFQLHYVVTPSSALAFCQVGKTRAEDEHSLHLVFSRQRSEVLH